jgi:hypothetical protein
VNKVVQKQVLAGRVGTCGREEAVRKGCRGEYGGTVRHSCVKMEEMRPAETIPGMRGEG